MGTMPQDSAAPENPQLPFEEQLMRELREHIFNKMPIRLLCFEPHGSSFQISLIERGAIYARVASALQAKIHDPAYIWADSTAGKEADDEIIGQLVTKHTQYAILSHTWFRTPSGEVSYGDWNEALFDANDPGYQKLVSFCKVAWRDHGLAFGWMDTVCINKQSSSELDESIRSMYNWYNRAAVCIVYLAETRTLSNVHLDPWFTRGWTLQELLAPEVIKSYDEHWKRFVNSCDNDKEDKTIMKQIKQATTISKEEFKNIRVAPISRIMQLAAPREVTREEDTAYSLMGIFDASISTAYGEGAARAFSRLLQEILASREDVLDILNWAGDLPSSPTYTSRILPSSPKYYINRYSVQWLAMGFAMTRPTEPLTLTHLGLRVQVVLMPGMSIVYRTST
ncbi:hypothetical protein BJ912DRAFT_635108 [Pholiota molesta]|nr:hypothetical protein BJ912DRAFT_635108 [Pholiota molesta]